MRAKEPSPDTRSGAGRCWGPQWGLRHVGGRSPPGQRLVEDTDNVGDDGGGKLRSSSTATPTLLRRVNMQDAATHLLVLGLYFSMELRLELPSLPPTAYSQPSMATRSWVLLGAGQVGENAGWSQGAPPHSPGVEPWTLGGAPGGGATGPGREGRVDTLGALGGRVDTLAVY